MGKELDRHLPPRTERKMSPPHKEVRPAPIGETAVGTDGHLVRRSLPIPKPCQTLMGTRSGYEESCALCAWLHGLLAGHSWDLDPPAVILTNGTGEWEQKRVLIFPGAY